MSQHHYPWKPFDKKKRIHAAGPRTELLNCPFLNVQLHSRPRIYAFSTGMRPMYRLSQDSMGFLLGLLLSSKMARYGGVGSKSAPPTSVHRIVMVRAAPSKMNSKWL